MRSDRIATDRISRVAAAVGRCRLVSLEHVWRASHMEVGAQGGLWPGRTSCGSFPLRAGLIHHRLGEARRLCLRA